MTELKSFNRHFLSTLRRKGFLNSTHVYSAKDSGGVINNKGGGGGGGHTKIYELDLCFI